MKARVLSPVYLLLMALALFLPPLLSPANALRFLGGADIGLYCRTLFGADAGAALENQTAYGWYCKDKRGHKIPHFVSVTQACRDTHKNPNAVDFLDYFWNPDSWKCYDDAEEMGDVDFERYCKHLGHKGFKVFGITAYDMYCETRSGHLVDVLDINHSATPACQWTFANLRVKARLVNFYTNNPKEAWKCWE